MFDILEAVLPPRFRALDLGCGPGSLAARLLRRFPKATVVAVDFDPVVLRIGREALGDQGGRLSWVEADLAEASWARGLPERRYDAALSTTALHWLAPRSVERLYRDLHLRLRPGGLFLNGDYLPWGASARRLHRLANRVRSVRFSGVSLQGEWAGWNRWWKHVGRLPELRRELAVRGSRFSGSHPHHREVDAEFHLRALRRAGFREAEVVWQDLENRTVLAVR